MNMILLRNTQGLHAPLRIAMEVKAAEKIGRLPFLPSSNVMRDILLGQDQDMRYLSTIIIALTICIRQFLFICYYLQI